ncbi:MAG: cation-transporting P-type ATPase [Candidatus Diapherotrites archaeon]|nr:cation-transporting P-type ATPase [Candidatus Diapherotrites archaeon]
MINKGLSSAEALRLLEIHGLNEIARSVKLSPLKIFLSQFTSPLILLLIAAAVVSFSIGFLPGQEPRVFDTALILLIVFASGIAGFIQEFKAEKAVEALQEMSSPSAVVLRDGVKKRIPVKELVPGDIIFLESGDVVPADAKLLEVFSLKVNESILTGESDDVLKKVSDTVFKNTSVFIGRAEAVVEKTGMNSKIGGIAKKLEEIKEEKTPFQNEMNEFSKKLILLTLGIILIIFFIALFKYGLYDSILVSVSLAVAAIPEGLPAVVTLALALGSNAMAKRNALVRKLSVTESAGAIDIICTDKTGTLTKNEMTVSNVFIDSVLKPEEITVAIIKENNALKNLFLCGALCNDSEKQEEKYLGDQTEIALKKISDSFFSQNELIKYWRVNEIPFSSERKMMSVVVKQGDSKTDFFVFSKGAPEILIESCTKFYENGKIVSLTSKKKKEILQQNKEFASKTLRVLGFAFKETHSKEKDLEENLVWIGLQAMRDPPHEEVKQALADCLTAGIRVIMITGDNPETAKAIADEINLKSKDVIEGKELEKLTDSELEKKLKSGVNIFARADSFHKLRILEILKKNYRVAMTGDGVNDALTLKKADVGISMGLKGTEIAKQASDIILLDDNFNSIKAAVEEGRRIFDNIRKFVNYLLTCNIAEVTVVFLATVFLTLNQPILMPVHLLWINLLTDGLPALALGLDPAVKGIMKKPPRKKSEGILNKRLLMLITFIGVKKALMLLVIFLISNHFYGFEVARTCLFTGFILYEFIRIGSIRFQEQLTWLSNKWLLAALAFSVMLQLFVIYTPLNSLFHVVPLDLIQWIFLLGMSALAYITSIAVTKIVIMLTPNET